MRAYVAPLNADSELRELVPEDALPNGVLNDLLGEWSLPAMTTVWAVLGDEDAEAVRVELAALDRRHGDMERGSVLGWTGNGDGTGQETGTRK
jgi:hypothetical protein